MLLNYIKGLIRIEVEIKLGVQLNGRDKIVDTLKTFGKTGSKLQTSAKPTMLIIIIFYQKQYITNKKGVHC